MRAIWKALAIAVVAVIPTTASATFHKMKIVEVFPGSAAMPNAQYVLLRAFARNQSHTEGHEITVYNADATIAAVATFSGDLENGNNQDYALVATPDAETLLGITADVSVPALNITPSGGRICFESFDCFSWGSFLGSRKNPSESGTPYAEFGGLTLAHVIERDISAGSPTLLEDGDDTGDSAADFACVATADPTNNTSAASTPYTDASPCPLCGDNTQETGEECDGSDDAACTGACLVDCRCPHHDALVFGIRPLAARVTSTGGGAGKTIRVKVRNTDTHAGTDVIHLGLSHDCPVGVTVSDPDFAPPLMIDTSPPLAAGRTAKAQVSVDVSPVFTFASAVAPLRCTITLTATAQVAGNIDPNATNNVALVELDIVDDVDVVAATHETYVLSARPATAKIKKGQALGSKVLKGAVANGDAPPDADSISLASTTCPAVTIASIDMDPDAAGIQGTAAVDGEDTASTAVTVSLSSTAISTPNKKSPLRCVLDLEATGPSDPDPMPSNNVTRQVIDIIDGNDL